MARLTLMPRLVLIALGIAGVTVIYLFVAPEGLPGVSLVKGRTQVAVGGPLPPELFDLGVYNVKDFTNERGMRPPFWSNATTRHGDDRSWGPCYAPRPKGRGVNWKKKVNATVTNGPIYPEFHGASANPPDVAGLCRPSFLIIGAGKCGTSSLYHYLVDHPRVLPAKQKQIHYFKYFARRPLKWYYGFFPTTTSFLASGALMTGEASPGYLPYPDVAQLIYNRLPGVRFIMLGRNPIERMYSSYQYNYVVPMIEDMKKGRVRRIEKDHDDDYYHKYLFSFEEMVVAELRYLQQHCLDESSGTAIVGAEKQYSKYRWVKDELARRKEQGLPPLADIDSHCYGNRVNSKVLRRQWYDLQTANPDKVILDHNTHLIQSFIGRSLYALPLEWWYARFGDAPIYFVCTEELSDTTGRGVARVATFLGLPNHDFSESVQKGAYNVGGHRGYDKEVPWDVIANDTQHASVDQTIPLSDEVMKQVKAFLHPYNERLFRLTGRRCRGW